MIAIRPAVAADAAAIAAIYNEGIAERSATFETVPRSIAENTSTRSSMAAGSTSSLSNC